MPMSTYSVQSTHNEDACDFLGTKTPRYADWEITTLFYAALHSINAYFELRGVRIPHNHVKRLRMVKRELPAIAKAYERLQSLSENSRYGGMGAVDGTSMKSARTSYSEITDHLSDRPRPR